MKKHISESGFTLVELSIVLVIIGLITGGILVGRNLIEAAEIRATVSQIEKYNSAVNTFRTKYNCLPGDCLSSQASALGLFTLSGCAVSQGCGDGDGLIEDGWETPNQNNAGGEGAVIWAHLSQANLIDYTPDIGDGCIESTGVIACFAPGLFPMAKLGRGNYIIAGSASGYNYWAITGIPSMSPPSQYLLANSLTPIEAYNIDTKMDDGLPNSGQVQARSNASFYESSGAYSPLADLTTSNAGSYAQTPTSGKCLMGGTLDTAIDTADVYNVNTSNGGNTQACELRLRWN